MCAVIQLNKIGVFGAGRLANFRATRTFAAEFFDNKPELRLLVMSMSRSTEKVFSFREKPK